MRILSCNRRILIVFVFFSFIIITGSPYCEEFDVETVSVDTDRMNRYLVSESKKLGEEAWKRIDTREKLEAERETLRREFRFMLGLEPLPERSPMNVILVNTVERDEYTVEVLHYQSLPDFYVSANLYKPKQGNAPFPAVIWGPGHSPHPNGAKALRQNYAIPWVRAGYICLMIDPIQVAELYGVHHGIYSMDHYDWFSRGYTPAGIEVWNAMRGVDYLLTRPDVDGDKLTINGVSGGGHLSWMTGAADDRITVVQPVAGTADVRAHIELDLQSGHCDCAYFTNLYRHDWPTLAALISPRPLLMLNSTEDGIYPPEGYKRVLSLVQDIYTYSGVPDKTGMFEVQGRHGYYQSQREKAVEWSNLWLLGKNSKVTERPFEEIPGQQLAAFGDGNPPGNINDRVQDILIPTAQLETCRSLPEWKKKRETILRELKAIVFRNMPQPLQGTQILEDDHERIVLETEPGIQVGMSAYIPGTDHTKRPVLVYIASPGETENSAWAFLRSYPYQNDPTVKYILYPRGIGTEIWNETDRRRFERCAMLLGRTVDDMRLYDVLCAIDYAASQPFYDGRGITVIGKGELGILGVYAALLDDRVGRVILHSPPLTHKSGPTFLNVLRYTDIPQALAMIAPRELVILTHEIEQFDYTRSVYKLYRAENRFRRAYSVTQVMNVKD